MTRLRQIALAGLAALAVGGTASSAFAEQAGTFQNRLNGATIGLPLGALPPPGLYSGLETAYLGLAGQNGGKRQPGRRTCCTCGSASRSVPLRAGLEFLGRHYSAWAWCKPSTCSTSSRRRATLTLARRRSIAHGEVLANTTFSPMNLSWNLGGGWFYSVSFNFMAPDGSRWVGTPNPDYWTLEPAMAISYLANNWVLSANFFYDVNPRSNGPCCVAVGLTGGGPITSGNTLLWRLHLASTRSASGRSARLLTSKSQTTGDTGPGCAIPGNCGNLRTVDVGGLVGYDFGPVDIQAWVTQSVFRQDAIDGLTFWSRIGFKLWGPEAPKPLVAKN